MPAPVVAAAGAGTKKAAAGKASAAARSTSTAEAHRAAIDAIKAKRKPEPEPETAESSAEGASSSGSGGKSSGRRELPGVMTDQRGAPSWWRVDAQQRSNAGGGFVLGMLAYVVGLTYLRGGKPAVKQLLRAKFFNEVGQ